MVAGITGICRAALPDGLLTGLIIKGTLPVTFIFIIYHYPCY
jgi:hypothetical protein